MLTHIIKRDGSLAEFNWTKIANAISKAVQKVIIEEGCGGVEDVFETRRIAQLVCQRYQKEHADKIPTVEEIQDLVEETLSDEGHPRIAKEYILYRAARTRKREMGSNLMLTMKDLTFVSTEDNDLARENANIDGNTAMGTMLRYGSEVSKSFSHLYVLDPKHSEAHRAGDIHIHDLDFYNLTTTCLQLPIKKLFTGGFSTGHGYLREPNDIASYSALACIAIQSNQNEQHGGQSIPDFDYAIADGVRKTYRKLYIEHIGKALEFTSVTDTDDLEARYAAARENCADAPEIKFAGFSDNEKAREIKLLVDAFNLSEKEAAKTVNHALKHAHKITRKKTFQAMEALVHNLNTMNSRAGAQVPFSSINYGTDTSPEGRLVTEQVLLALQAGLGRGEIPLFPIHIFKTKDGVNYNPEDPNYDLFKLATKTAAQRIYPNFSFLDAPFNKQFYVAGRPETEAAYMGCRTRVISNIHDPNQQTVHGRGNLNFTTINLPRLAIEATRACAENSDFNATELFFESLNEKMDLVIDQMLARYQILANKKVKNFPFLMGQGAWLDSDKLGPNDKIGEVLKHGTLSMGFIGLAEVLKLLNGKHHGESEESQKLGLKIVGVMRDKCDEMSKLHGINFSLLATPAEGLCARFTEIDRKRYGEIDWITSKGFYTNSYHVPVDCEVTAYNKIHLEAPYHALTNAGHITTVEVDGNMSNNLEAYEKIIRCMKEAGIGYGGVNHPVDTDPVCGYTGIIGDECPKCGRKETESYVDENGIDKGIIKFVRTRRITGYLGDAETRFNNGKLKELAMRRKHMDSNGNDC